jgi:cysteinyl-tRNA synthetase
MSKSDGNFVTIHDLLHTDKFGGRKWPGEVLRLAMLMTHYREPIDFSVKRLEEAENTLRKLHRASDNNKLEWECLDQIDLSVLSDDMSFNSLLAHLAELSLHALGRDFDGWGHEEGYAHIDGSPIYTESQYGAAAEISAWLSLTGLEASTVNVDFHVVQKFIDQRLQLLNDKNFAEADRIRDELLEQGIQLKDGKDPETGERVTTWEVKR